MPFFRYPDRRREVPLRMIIPNLLTTIALCSGLASVHFSLKADWDMALKAVLVAALFDLLDGRAARLLKATSPFGTMLDSLSDFLSFGMAPAVLLHEWTLREPQVLGRDADVFALAAMMTFVLCSGLRLARFTAATRQVRSSAAPAPEPRPNPLASKYFTGLPTPAAAAAVLIPPMLDISPKVHVRLYDWVVILFTFVVAFMMIGRQPMFSLKKIRIPRRLVAPLLVLVGLFVVAVIKFPWITAAVVAGGYLLTAPLSYTSYRRAVRRQRAEGSGGAPAAA
jgi:CDP-diacylglycerol--serine O-phosphatidyltransferase